MVIRGGTRGNGRQLANYLTTMAENEHIEILDIDGYENRSVPFLKQTLLSMSLTAELTKSDKGLYHAQINPAYGDDKTMTHEKWHQAADMMGEALGLKDQRRVIVLHVKQNRVHAHVVWERYDHEKGRIISDSFSRLAQNRVRKEMEQVFEHKKTPEKNPHRPEMKEALSRLWQRTKSGADFIREAQKAGYSIGASTARRPFIVIDEHGRSFDLVRQLDKVKTKDVRERFKGEKLPDEKKLIKATRNRNHYNESQERMIDKRENFKSEKAAQADEKKKNVAEAFASNKSDAVSDKEKPQRDFEANKADTSNKKISKKQKVANEFAANRNDALSEKERVREETKRIIREMQENKSKKKGMSR